MSQFPFGLGLAAANPADLLYRDAAIRVLASSGESLHLQLPYTGEAVTGFDADGQLVEMPADELYPVHDRVTGEMLGYPFLPRVVESVFYNNKPLSQWGIGSNTSKSASPASLWGIFEDAALVTTSMTQEEAIGADLELSNGSTYAFSVIVAPGSGGIAINLQRTGGYLSTRLVYGTIGGTLNSSGGASNLGQIEIAPGIWCIRFMFQAPVTAAFKLWVSPSMFAAGTIHVLGAQCQRYQNSSTPADPWTFIPTTTSARIREQAVGYTSVAPPPEPWNMDEGTLVADVAGRGLVAHRFDETYSDEAMLIELLGDRINAVRLSSVFDRIEFPAVSPSTFVKVGVTYKKSGSGFTDYRACLADEIEAGVGFDNEPKTRKLAFFKGFVGHVRTLVYMRRALTDLQLKNITL